MSGTKKLFQCQLDAKLIDAVRKRKRSHGIKWRDLLDCMFRHYLDTNTKIIERNFEFESKKK